MNVFLNVIPLVVQAILSILLQPLYWMVVLIIAYQFRRLGRMKEKLFGVPSEPVWGPTLQAVLFGMVGGLMGSLVMVLLGVALTGVGIAYLWILAILLMFIRQRFLCFAYSGGIIAVVSLLVGGTNISLGWFPFTFPKVNVPQLMSLVGVLHLVESLLILWSGHLGAVPVYLQSRNRQVVGGFNLQRFWPIPIVVFAVLPSMPQLAGNLTPMPDWWPLLKSGLPGNPQDLIYVLFPVIAGLGYGDLALTGPPEAKSRFSAALLFAYSIILLSLAVAASKWSPLQVVAALFAPLGHEAIIRIGQHREFRRPSAFVPVATGVKILDVVTRSPAAEAGIRSGDIIRLVNGHSVNNRGELGLALALPRSTIVLEYMTVKGENRLRHARVTPGTGLGLITVPEPGDPYYLESNRLGLATRLWHRWVKKT